MVKSAASASLGSAREAGGNPDHVYRVIEIVGTSKRSFSEAIDNGIARAGKTLRNVRWFEVERISGRVEDGKVAHYQATMSVGFTMDEPE
jgi:flavin-binding protein dodecin